MNLLDWRTENMKRSLRQMSRRLRPSWQLVFGGGLVAASAVLYALHYLVFRDAHHIIFWSLTSLAVMPISVLFVTLSINRLLTQRQQQARLRKLNMVIGAFFSEVGTDLLARFTDHDPEVDGLRGMLFVKPDWSSKQFVMVRRLVKKHPYKVVISRSDLGVFYRWLRERRDFLLRLLENPNLLDHEAFTAALRAVFHLLEELDHREDFSSLPDSDIDHLEGDARRAYALLVQQWIDYMVYLKERYPYLFSLALRTNPFDRVASPVVTSPG